VTNVGLRQYFRERPLQQIGIKQLENAAFQPRLKQIHVGATHNESTIRIDFDPAPRDVGLCWPGIHRNDVEQLSR
jgi:hypothetical protein